MKGKDEKSMEKEIERKSLYRRVTCELHKIGTPAHIKGHNYLRTAIIKMYEDATYHGNMMKRLYPDVADEYETNVSCVERGIRNAIEVAWSRGNLAILEEIFGNTISYSKTKPTHSEFIAMIVDRLKLEDLE